MAALTAVESSNKVWQRVKTALVDANPAAQAAFLELKKYLATQKRNIDLQVVFFTKAQGAAAGGTQLGTGTATIYGWFSKKAATATQNTIKLYDDATDDTTAANAVAAIDHRVASDQAFEMFPLGKAIANGIVVTAHTTLLGTTDGSAANDSDGFIIYGA